MKFPQVIRHRKSEAVIYGKTALYPRYQLSYQVGKKRRQRSFSDYQAAKQEAEHIVRQLSNKPQAASLTEKQALDALAALDRLKGFWNATGRKVSLLSAIAEYCESAAKLHGASLASAVDGYLRTVASIKRKDLGEAVEEFIGSQEPRTKSRNRRRVDSAKSRNHYRSVPTPQPPSPTRSSNL